ncbi:MAG: hypothetical protein AB7I32_14480 [Gammaproteobacteria bacterium]
MKDPRSQRLRLVATISIALLCAGGAALADATRGPWSEKDFLDLVMNHSSTDALAALGDPAAKSVVGNGLEMWVYHNVVKKPKQAATFPVTQLVVSEGQVVQIGHSEREPPER